MTSDFDYKKYSLENLENWLHDAMSADEATPQEIYDTIKGVVEENYYTYKQKTSEAYELLALLNGNGIGHITECDEYSGSTVSSVQNTEEVANIDGYSVNGKSHSEFWYDYDRNDPTRPNPFENDRVVKWQLPVEVDGPSGEYYVMFPDDLLEAANLKEGDSVEWVDNGDGSFTLKKV